MTFGKWNVSFVEWNKSRFYDSGARADRNDWIFEFWRIGPIKISRRR